MPSSRIRFENSIILLRGTAVKYNLSGTPDSFAAAMVIRWAWMWSG